jgi:hypothetical protein
MYLFICICSYTYINTHICVYTYTCIYVYSYMYIFICKYIYCHIYTQSSAQQSVHTSSTLTATISWALMKNCCSGHTSPPLRGLIQRVPFFIMFFKPVVTSKEVSASWITAEYILKICIIVVITTVAFITWIAMRSIIIRQDIVSLCLR